MIGLGLFILLIAVFCAFLARWRMGVDKRNAKLFADSMNWPTVPGEITDVRIDQTRTMMVSNSSDTTSETVRYQPKVDYLYAVGGQQYQGSRINFTIMDFSFENRARKAIENYKVGATLPVAYDPADPQNSVLDRDTRPREVNISTIVLFVVSGVIALLGVALFFVPGGCASGRLAHGHSGGRLTIVKAAIALKLSGPRPHQGCDEAAATL